MATLTMDARLLAININKLRQVLESIKTVHSRRTVKVCFLYVSLCIYSIVLSIFISSARCILPTTDRILMAEIFLPFDSFAVRILTAFCVLLEAEQSVSQ